MFTGSALSVIGCSLHREGSKDMGCEEDPEKPRKTPRSVKLMTG